MSTDEPHFRFHPGAYRDGRCFEASDARCDVCSLPSVWRYAGSIYALKRPAVCARCIASGALAAFLGGRDFALHDIEIDGADATLEVELLQRTPGVACFNPYAWPVLDGRPLAFLGYGEDGEVAADPAAQTAIAAAYAEMGWDDVEPNPADPYALVFRELVGGRYRAVIDLD